MGIPEDATAAAIAEAFGAGGIGGGGDRRPWRLTVVVFDGVPLGGMSFAFGVFDAATYFDVLPGLDLRIVAGEPDASIVGGRLALPIPYDLTAIADADLVIVPTLPQPKAERPPEPVLEALRAAHARGTRLASVCNGTFVLAAAGLLDGRPATTHWSVAGRLRELHPKVQVDPTVLYVDDGDVLTAGGAAAGLDLGLHIMRTTIGAGTANRLGRALVVAPHRSGGQAQFIESPMPEIDEADPVGEAIAWAVTHLDRPLRVGDLAARAHMSRRNFDRRFREITGATPGTWITHQRVIRAQQLLESGGLPVDEVARQCGFSSAAALRPHFRRLVGVAPTAYRHTFTHQGEP